MKVPTCDSKHAQHHTLALYCLLLADNILSDNRCTRVTELSANINITAVTKKITLRRSNFAIETVTYYVEISKTHLVLCWYHQPQHYMTGSGNDRPSLWWLQQSCKSFSRGGKPENCRPNNADVDVASITEVLICWIDPFTVFRKRNGMLIVTLFVFSVAVEQTVMWHSGHLQWPPLMSSARNRSVWLFKFKFKFKKLLFMKIHRHMLINHETETHEGLFASLFHGLLLHCEHFNLC